MNQGLNAQLNYADPNSLAIRVSTKMRQTMFRMFMKEFRPAANENVLDVGVTSDQSYDNSNYFEELYPHRSRIVAVGLQEAAFIEHRYAGVRFIQANALDLPFADGSFDLVHSAAVLEHVGSIENQSKMISECVRVARRGVCLTTPNRWFPIEFHTQLPLVHWMPKGAGRYVFRKLGFGELADEAHLNLMTSRELKRLADCISGWRFHVVSPRLCGWRSNLVLFGHSESHVASKNNKK